MFEHCSRLRHRRHNVAGALQFTVEPPLTRAEHRPVQSMSVLVN
jgi:hypothetical protein